MTKHYGLIGYPLGHSFSGEFFKDKFEKLNLDASYHLYEMAELDALPQLLNQTNAPVGLNVTIPFKVEVLKYLHVLSEEAEKIGAVNCIRIEGNKLIGYNTDWIGFKNSLLPHLKIWHQQALILGAGGATLAVKYALDKLGIKHHTVSRDLEKGDFTYDDLNLAIIRSHQIIINTTPLGMHPNENDAPQIPYEFITSKHLAFDLIYNPAETLFLKKAKQQQASTLNGLNMLTIQAEKSWEIWNNKY